MFADEFGAVGGNPVLCHAHVQCMLMSKLKNSPVV